MCEISRALNPGGIEKISEWKESMMLKIKVALVEFVETYEDGNVYIVSGDGSRGYGIGVVGLDGEYRPPIDAVRLLKDVTEYLKLMSIITKEQTTLGEFAQSTASQLAAMLKKATEGPGGGEDPGGRYYAWNDVQRKAGPGPRHDVFAQAAG